MNENCKDCIQVENLKDSIKSVWYTTNEIKDQNKDFEKRINELEINKGETAKQLESISGFLERIEKAISTLTSEITNIKNKPLAEYEKLKWVVITGFASSIIGVVLGMMAKK
jgi:septal ring factor EnvC (AmiA/AmiB activator)